MQVTIEQIAEFFEKPDWSTSCAVCHGDRWNVMGTDGDNIVSVPIRRKGELGTHDATKQLPVVTLLCEACGYVRMHALAVFERELGKAQDDTDE